MNGFSLPRFAIQRPVTVIMLTICMLILGGIAWTRMPLKFLPEVDQPFLGVSIPYPGATPEQVAQEIAIEVEGEFRTVAGLRQIRTISNSDGCFASMLFELDTDMTLATAEIRDRMERLKLVLPAEVDRMFIQRFSTQSIPIIAFGIFKAGDQEKFAHTVRTVLEPRLRRVEGVADVQVRSPIPEKEVLVEFDQNNLRGMNLALSQVIGLLRQGSLNLSIGALAEGDSKYLVRALGEYRDLSDIEDLIVGPNALRLRDIATVRYSSRGDEASVSLDGKGGNLVLITKESEANTVETCEGVRQALDATLAQPQFEEVAKLVFFDQSELITGALENLVQEGVYGAVMAIVVLFLFLHRIRPTIVVSLTIPTSLVIVVVFMFFAGMSLNLITMVSMIISVGMLLDNSIVIVENIIRYRQLGMDRFASAVRGTEEVSLAVTASTATSLVVFVPMYFLEAGQMSVFMNQLGLPLIVMQTGSLLIALTLIPLIMSRMSSSHASVVQRALHLVFRKPQQENQRPVLIQRLVDRYSRALRLALTWRLATTAALAALVAVTILYPYRQMGMRDMPQLDTREVKINIEVDPNYDMPMTTSLFNLLEGEIDRMRGELGIKSVLSFYQKSGGSIEAYLYTEEDGPKGENPKYTTEQVMLILSERLGKYVPGAELKMMLTEEGNTGAESGISVQLRGSDTKLLAAYADQFKAIMEKMQHVYDVTTDIERSNQEMQIHIDEALASQAGVSAIAIAQTVDAALRGARLPELKAGGREIPVWAQFREEHRISKANLDNVTVASAAGGLVPLNQLVDYSKTVSPASIQRVNGKNVVTLNAKTSTENLSDVIQELDAAMEAFELPPGYSLELGDQLMELSENIVNFVSTMLMAVILVYIVMAALFESYLLPLSILTTVPLALGGAVWMLFFCGTQMDTVTFVGCVMMAGVIVNNGIVIVDHINCLRKEGLPRMDAIVKGGNDRFRPVMMTALTTILGLVPLALATTGGAATFAGLGQALIGGMTAGTILTLVVVPLFYTFFDDLQEWVLGIAANFRPQTAASTPRLS